MTALAVDIETVPTESALDMPYPEADRSPPANYKSADAIARWRESDVAAWRESSVKQYSLSPLYGRVVAIGLAWDPPNDFTAAIETHALLAPSEGDEKALLEAFWERAQDADVLLTWNGFSFDIPFLLTRSALHGLRGLPGNLLRRYQTSGHYDVKQVLNGWDSSKLRGGLNSLDDWAKAFGLGAKVSHGSEVYRMFREGRFEDIGLYAADDARKTLQLYNATSHIFG